MKTFTLWEEGYACTGEHGSANYLGKWQGENFMDAYLAMVKAKYGNPPPNWIHLDKPCIWGCNVYDNERDARKSFG